MAARSPRASSGDRLGGCATDAAGLNSDPIQLLAAGDAARLDIAAGATSPPVVGARSSRSSSACVSSAEGRPYIDVRRPAPDRLVISDGFRSCVSGSGVLVGPKPSSPCSGCQVSLAACISTHRRGDGGSHRLLEASDRPIECVVERVKPPQRLSGVNRRRQTRSRRIQRGSRALDEQIERVHRLVRRIFARLARVARRRDHGAVRDRRGGRPQRVALSSPP